MPKCAFIALLAAILPLISWAAEPREDLSEKESYLKLFFQLAGACPLDNQEATIDLADDIHGKYLRNKKNVENLDPRIDALYAEIRDILPVLEVAWRDGAPVWAVEPQRLTVAKGVQTWVLVEITNEEAEDIDVEGAFAETPIPEDIFMTPLPPLVPAGAMRVRLLPLNVKEDTQALNLRLTEGEKAALLPVPVKVMEPAVLRGKLLDSDTGEVFPGRVYIKGSDGILRHAKAYADNETMSEKRILTVRWPAQTYKFPFCYSDGTFEIELPPGATEVTLERGFEHEIVTETVTLKAGKTKDFTISSGRIVNMKELGWISGDTHVHWAKNWWDENEDLDLLAVVQRAEDVRVVNNLTLRHHRPPKDEFVSPTQFPMGPAPGYCDGEYHVQMCEEYRNDDFYGHVNMLNIKQLVWPISTGEGIMGPGAYDYPPNLPKLQEAIAQGGIVCAAHGIPNETVADIALGAIQTLDQLSPGEYYKVLDAGFRLPLTNGSDHPARITGCCRAYVKVDGDFTYQKWIDGIKAARTFTTSGPLLFLNVNGADIGDEVQLRQGDTMTVVARAVSRHPLGRFQILANERVLKEVVTEDTEAELRVDVPVEESAWVVARCRNFTKWNTWNALHGPGIAHTSAVYVVVDGKPIFKEMAAWEFITRLRHWSERVKAEANFENDAQLQEVLAIGEAGTAAYEKLIDIYGRE